MGTEYNSEELALNSAQQTIDTEAQTTPSPPPPKPKSKHRRRNICLAVTASIIVTIAVVIVILAFTVFKAKDPDITIDAIDLQNFRMAMDDATRTVDLNMTLDVDLTVKNPNKVGLDFKNGSAWLSYKGELVGEVPIPAGNMGADATRPMNVTVTVMADRLLSNSELYNEVRSGVLSLSTLVKLSGKVEIFKIIKISVDTTTNCDFTIFVANVSIADQNCNTKAKL